MRLFLAIDLPEQLQSDIESLYLPELQNVRWTNSLQLHVTLVFIGEQEKSRLDEIIEAVGETPFQPITLSVEGVNHFKSGIIHLQIKENTELNTLHQRLHQKLAELGIHIEKRKYKPHITLGRCQKLDAQIMNTMEIRAGKFTTTFTAERFYLKSSQLKNTGPVYYTEAEFLPD